MLPLERQIRTKAQLQDWLNYELPRYSTNNLHNILLTSEKAILRRHQLLLRKAEYYCNTGKRFRYFIYRRLLSRIQIRHTMLIPINCCDRGFHIMHLGPVGVNHAACVGKDCCFHLNSFLAAGGLDGSAPTLGDHVVVGIGSIVVGGVHIADNIAIGAGAVVNKDFLEPNIAIAGVPAKKISDNGAKNWNKDKKNEQK